MLTSGLAARGEEEVWRCGGVEGSRDAATHELHRQDGQVALHTLLEPLVELRAVPPQLDARDDAARMRVQRAREQDDDKDAQAGVRLRGLVKVGELHEGRRISERGEGHDMDGDAVGNDDEVVHSPAHTAARILSMGTAQARRLAQRGLSRCVWLLKRPALHQLARV